MDHSRTFILLATIYFASAEYDDLPYNSEQADDEFTQPEETAGIGSEDTYETGDISPIDLTSRAMEEADDSSIIGEETSDQSHRKLLPEENAGDMSDVEKYIEIGQEGSNEEIGNKHKNLNFKPNTPSDIDKELKTQPTKRKMLTNHVLVDTKGRTAAEEVNEEVLKPFLPDFGNVYDPRLINNHRNGHQISFYPTLRSGLFHGPLLTVNPPMLFKSPSSAEQKQIKTELPFINTNSYPYTAPLTENNHAHQSTHNMDVLNKLIDATNAAISSSNLYPGIINPLGIARFRRSLDFKINSLRAL